MRNLKSIEEFLSEAISMKMYKGNLPKELWYDKSEGYKNWDNLFGNGINRISIPLKSNSLDIPTSTPFMEEINSLFVPLGYKINSFEDYLNNKVYKIGDTKNPMKIGGLLKKMEDKYIFYRFDTSTERKEWKDKINNSDKDLKIIISRHPYDLLGMSSGRDWRLSSCMRLGSKDDKVYRDILCGVDDGGRVDGFTQDVNNPYYGWDESGGLQYKIKYDIEQGTLIAYVVKTQDNNINKPLSRLLIKPYVNEKDSNDIIWVSADKLYGQEVEGFKSSVDEWLGGWQGEDFNGIYHIKQDLYSDRKDKIVLNKPVSKWNDKDRKNFLNEICEGEWKLNSNGEVDVDGNVTMSKMGLTEIPVKFGNVSGWFRCGGNNLTSLKGVPTFVGSGFDCSSNQLTSLEFAPTNVGGFYCSSNQLTSLEFAPTTVRGGFYCYDNQLTSLEFAPTTVGRDFNCSRNELTSLEFAPTSVGGGFYCGSNQLTSLQYCPTTVGRDFNCYNNQLTSLEFAPNNINGDFECSENNIISLEFLPQNIEGKFNGRSQKSGSNDLGYQYFKKKFGHLEITKK